MRDLLQKIRLFPYKDVQKGVKFAFYAVKETSLFLSDNNKQTKFPSLYGYKIHNQRYFMLTGISPREHAVSIKYIDVLLKGCT